MRKADWCVLLSPRRERRCAKSCPHAKAAERTVDQARPATAYAPPICSSAPNQCRADRKIPWGSSAKTLRDSAVSPGKVQDPAAGFPGGRGSRREQVPPLRMGVLKEAAPSKNDQCPGGWPCSGPMIALFAPVAITFGALTPAVKQQIAARDRCSRPPDLGERVTHATHQAVRLVRLGKPAERLRRAARACVSSRHDAPWRRGTGSRPREMLQGSIYSVSVSRKADLHEDTIGLLRPRRSNTRGGLVLALSQMMLRDRSRKSNRMIARGSLKMSGRGP